MAGEKRNVSLNTGSVGAAIVLFGVVLISISMWCRPIKVTSTGGLKLESPFADNSTEENPTTFEF